MSVEASHSLRSRGDRPARASHARGGRIRQACVLCAICLIVWPPVVACQTMDPGALSGTLRDHLKNERFDVVTSIRGFPIGVRDGLRTLFGTQGLDIAEPGAEFQATEAIGTATLPLRRLIAGGCSRDFHCLVYYERGGGTRAWRVALFHWTPDVTRFEWGGNARGGLATIDDVRNAVLAGAVTGPATSW